MLGNIEQYWEQIEKHVAVWSMVKQRETDKMTVEMWDCFLSLAEGCVRTSAQFTCSHVLCLHQWLFNGVTERRRQHSYWMEAFVFPLTTNQPAKVRCVRSRHSRYCPRRYNPATTFHAWHLIPSKHDPHPRQSHETSCLFSVFDHRPFWNIFYFVLFFFRVFFVFKLKLFFLLKSFFLRFFLVFSRFFTPHLPSPSLLQDRGAEAAEPIKEQLKPLLQWYLAGYAAGYSAGKLVQVHPGTSGHHFMFPSWDPCAPHSCQQFKKKRVAYSSRHRRFCNMEHHSGQREATSK